MFEMSAWCYVVSVVLAAGVWLDGRRHGPVWRLPAIPWAAFVGVTWVGIILYLVARVRRPSVVEVG
jgi:hypothetical protein